MADVNMEEGRNDDTSLNYKLYTKQRIEQAKLRAAERRAREAAARRVEQASISPPRSLSSFVREPLLSTSNHASTESLFLRSPTTNHERVERTNALQALSKKIDRAGNFKLQELIMEMILKCPGAKEVADAFFISNGVKDNNEEDGERERDDAAPLEDAEMHNDNHVMHPHDLDASATSEEDQNRRDALETQAGSGSPTTIVQNQHVGEANARQDHDSSRLYSALSPDSTILHNNEAANQPRTLERRSRSDSVDSQGLVDRQLLTILNDNLQKDPGTIDGVRLETSSIHTATEALHTPSNGTLKEDVSGTDISKALDTLLSSVAKSRGITLSDNSTSATHQFSISGARESVMTPITIDRPQNDMLQLANDISVRYLALARASGVANFHCDQLTSISAGSTRNVSTKKFSFEAFNNFFDSFRRNIESIHKFHGNNEILGNMRSRGFQEDFSDASDLGSPIPIDINGQELDGNSCRIDSPNPGDEETTAKTESTDSEEDEYGFLDNMPSSHYNCDSCRKPIVLPEGSVVSLMSPTPTTCLHCKTLKAAGITRRRLGVGSRSSVVAESPNPEMSNRPSPDQVDQPVTETSIQFSRPVAQTSAPPPEAPLESLPECLPETLRESLPGQLPEPLPNLLSEPPREPLVEQFLQSIEIEGSDSGETPRDSGSGDGDNVKEEHHRGTVIVELPGWPSSASPCLSANQFLAHSQTSSKGTKRKVEYIEGEAIYSYPIGPKRRRGRPLKDYHAIVLDSSPSGSPQASTPTSRQSSQVGLSGKKRGRPFGSKNRVKSEIIDHNQPMNSPGAIRPTGQRQSAKKTREILRNVFNEELGSMEDATIRSVPVQVQIDSLPGTSSTIPDLQATSGHVIPTKRRARRDLDPDYMPTWESEVRSGTTSNGMSTSSSVDGAVSNIANESGRIENTLNGSLKENAKEPGACNPQSRSSKVGDGFPTFSDRLDMAVRGQDREFPVAQSPSLGQEQSRPQPLMHPSGFYGLESSQPGRENLAARILPGEPLTESSTSSRLSGRALPWNVSIQDPDLTALPASSPTVQSLQEHTPTICCGRWSCRFNSRCEKKLSRRERKKQKRQNKLLAKDNGGENDVA
ncbi:hypothetical protein EAE96_009204 [Botrytis aclada]|nr:hypothetical protein EAE96_009204 [Botrytis aclada]